MIFHNERPKMCFPDKNSICYILQCLTGRGITDSYNFIVIKRDLNQHRFELFYYGLVLWVLGCAAYFILAGYLFWFSDLCMLMSKYK